MYRIWEKARSGTVRGLLNCLSSLLQQTSDATRNKIMRFLGRDHTFEHAKINVNRHVSVGNLDRTFYWGADDSHLCDQRKRER